MLGYKRRKSLYDIALKIDTDHLMPVNMYPEKAEDINNLITLTPKQNRMIDYLQILGRSMRSSD